MKCFIVLSAIINEIVFFISFFDNPLLIYRIATDFCMLILNPETLTNFSLTSDRFSLVESLGFSIHKIMSSANKDNSVSSFLIWMPISFSFLIALARTSSTMLNSGKSGYPCIFLDLREKVFNHSPLSMMLTVGLF